MSLKEKLRKTIPEKYQLTPEYNIFLKMIKQKKIDTLDKLKNYIDKQIKEDQKWLKEKSKFSKEGTMNRWLVKRAKRLDFFKTLKKKILNLL